nr:RNA polymerase sigma factor [Novosphingobium hassiacum]
MIADEPLGQAFREERSSLMHFLRRQAGPDAAPDLLQEVFARALRSPEAGRLANPGAFLRRIAGNLLIDRARRAKAGVVIVPLDDARDAPCAAEQGLALEAAQLLASYENAVRQMPAKTRQVFLMQRVDGHTYREIHERLGISVATVEYHMMKALSALAKALESSR